MVVVCKNLIVMDLRILPTLLTCFKKLKLMLSQKNHNTLIVQVKHLALVIKQHFGVIMMINLGIGLVTPPVGSVLFVGSAVGGIKVPDMVRTIWPFYLTLLAALALITFVPALSLALPEAF